MEDLVLTTEQIVERLNKGEYDDLAEFLQAIDWTQIAPETIIPRPVLRKFVRSISDKGIRLAVMEFLGKFAHDYFCDGAKRMEWKMDVGEDVEDEEDLEEYASEAASDIREMKSELNFQIDLVKSKDSPGALIDRQKRKIETLEKQVKELRDKNSDLETELDRFRHPYDYGKHIPEPLQNKMFYDIMSYLKNKQLVTISYVQTAWGEKPCCYYWCGTQSLFGYFVIHVSDALNLKKGRDTYNWQLFEPAFLNFDKVITEARKANSTCKKNNSKIKDSKKIDEAILFALKNDASK